MADEALIVDILTGKDTLTQTFKKIEQNAMNLGRLSGKGIDVSKEVSAMQDLTTETGELRRVFNNAFDEGLRKANQFDMRLLSIMFSGMALQRLFGGMLRSITTTFLRAEDDTSGLGVATQGLGAAWEFLKFSIFDALNNDLFIGFIEGLINAINWTSSLINKYPALGVAIIGAFGVLALGGTVMMIIAQFNLFWAATFGVGGVLSTTAAAGLGGVAGGTGTVAGSLLTFMTVIAPAIIGAGLVIWGIFRTVKSVNDTEETPFIEILKTALIGGVGVGLLTWNPVAGVLAAGVILINLMLSEESKKTISRIESMWRKSPASRSAYELSMTGLGSSTITNVRDTRLDDFNDAISKTTDNLDKLSESAERTTDIGGYKIQTNSKITYSSSNTMDI